MDWALLASLVSAGHAEQLVHAKEVAYHFFKQIFEVMDFHNDEHFYSPSLFALDSAMGSSDAVLLSLAAPIANSGGKFPFPIKARTNSNGALVIPAVGNIWTSHPTPNAMCKLDRITRNGWLASAAMMIYVQPRWSRCNSLHHTHSASCSSLRLYLPPMSWIYTETELS
jgi:hypothetical protein